MTLNIVIIFSFKLSPDPILLCWVCLPVVLHTTTVSLASLINSCYSHSRNTSPTSEHPFTPFPFFNPQLKHPFFHKGSQPLCLDLYEPTNIWMDHTTKWALTVHGLASENYVPLIQLDKCLSAYYSQSNAPGTEIIRAKPLC